MEAKETALKAKMATFTTKRLDIALRCQVHPVVLPPLRARVLTRRRRQEATFKACRLQNKCVTNALKQLQSATDLQAMRASSNERSQAIQDKTGELDAGS